VQRDFSGGVRSGVNGTLIFFINSKRHDGDFELETLLPVIQKMIHSHKNEMENLLPGPGNILFDDPLSGDCGRSLSTFM